MPPPPLRGTLRPMPLALPTMRTIFMPPGRIHVWQWVLLAVGAGAMLTAQAGWVELHRLFKPLAMVAALLAVCAPRFAPRSARRLRARHWLLAALAFSLAGDVCLMLDGLFIPGLVAFLCAHVCYIRLFALDAPWLPRRTPLAACLLLAAGVYSMLWGHLPAELRLPVAAYVLVIALMAAQAVGRALVRASRAARCVAYGALLFMLSDTLLAVDRFVHPLAWAGLGVLGTYYAAQWLIVHGMLQTSQQA